MNTAVAATIRFVLVPNWNGTINHNALVALLPHDLHVCSWEQKIQYSGTNTLKFTGRKTSGKFGTLPIHSSFVQSKFTAFSGLFAIEKGELGTCTNMLPLTRIIDRVTAT